MMGIKPSPKMWGRINAAILDESADVVIVTMISGICALLVQSGVSENEEQASVQLAAMLLSPDNASKPGALLPLLKAELARLKADRVTNPAPKDVISAPENRMIKTTREDLDTSIDPATGMQREYLVLSEEERAKGFVQPVRRSYVHEKCGGVTTMGQALAETYARNPAFYSGTYCATCKTHFPVGESGEFVWHGTTQKVGTVP